MRLMSWRLLVAAPFLLLIIVFALSNPQGIRLGLWPTDFKVDAPLSLAMLVTMALAFLLGALLVWPVTIGIRMRARRAERTITMLQADLAKLNAQLKARGPSLPAQTLLPPPPKGS